MGVREWWYIANTRKRNMDLEAKQRKQSALRVLLNQMDVPVIRTDVTNVGNLRWLMRNLAVRNGERSMFNTAVTMIRELLRE